MRSLISQMRSFNLAPASIPIMSTDIAIACACQCSSYPPSFNFAPQFSPITNVPRSLNPAPVIISHVIICLPAPAIAIAIACACQCLSLFLISYSPNFPRSPTFVAPPQCLSTFALVIPLIVRHQC